jgi:hypothetical protein
MIINRPVLMLGMLLPLQVFADELPKTNPTPEICADGDVGCTLRNLPWVPPPIVSNGPGVIEQHVQDKDFKSQVSPDMLKQQMSPDLQKDILKSLQTSPSLQQLK